jgi:Tfp pilus assembly protein FimT
METNKKNNEYRRGVTLLELFVGVGIISLMLTMGVSGLKYFSRRVEINNGLRTVTSALSTARYDSVMTNIPVKFTIEDKRIVLKQQQGTVWKEYKDFKLEEDVSFSLNANPVFYPVGSIAPLCSIFVRSSNYNYKITLSIVGQIKVTDLDHP